MTEYLDHADRWLMRINLLLLLFVSFLPFPTKLLAESVDHEDAGRVATTIYGLTLLVTTLLVSALWRYAVLEHLIRLDTADEEVDVLTKKLTPGLGGYAAMIVLGIFEPVLAVLGYLAIAIYYLVPLRFLRRRARRDQGAPASQSAEAPRPDE